MMEDNRIITFTYKKGIQTIHPAHQFVKSWVFEEGEALEAMFCHYMAQLADKNGMSSNDMMHLFPAVLRMLKSKSKWTNLSD